MRQPPDFYTIEIRFLCKIGKESLRQRIMQDLQPGSVTQLLIRWGGGDRDCLNALLPVVEDELHRIALRYMRRERTDHTLQTTALINEAYLRLVDQSRVNLQNRAHFFAAAARIMRQILVD